MASEEANVDKENAEVMDIEEGKDTADEAHKELFSLESILIVHVVASTCAFCCCECCCLKRVQFSRSSRNHRITMGYYMVTTRGIAGTVAGGYTE